MDGTAEKERVQNEERAEDSFKGQEEKEEPSEEFEKESCAVMETKTKSFKLEGVSPASNAAKRSRKIRI